MTARLKVSSIRREADGVVSLDLCAEDGSPLPEWNPGAHIEIELADKLIRHYSLCSAPTDSYRWRIAVLREPASRGGSELIHETLRPGHVLNARNLRNNFGLVDADRYIFVAGGIGITPILPMVTTVAQRGKPWTLVYGGRTRSSMAFVEELSELSGGDLHVLPEDEHGLLDLDAFLSTPQLDTAVYCCGPGPLIDTVEKRCVSWPVGALRLERFVPKAVPCVRPDGEFEVRLSKSGKTLRVPPHQSLLDVLEDAGYTIDNSCRAGICGTCVVPVVQGVPEHNDDILSDTERESNAIILPCVSRSRSAVLVVDL